MEKKCTKCKDAKPISEFHYRKDKERYRYQCKLCTNKATQEYYKKRSEFRKQRSKERYADNKLGYKDTHYNSKLLKTYGISLEDKNKMLENQDYSCKICGIEESSLNKRMAVDHCHTTGKVRGLLCDRCNRGIGWFDDNPELLRKAAEYLD